MATATPNRAANRPGRRESGTPGLKVSAFDNVASLILSLLILLSAIVIVLFSVWVGNKMFRPQLAVPVVLEDVGGGRPDGVVGESMALDAPDSAEIARGTDLEAPQIQDTLSKVSSVISAHVTELEDPGLVEQVGAPGGGKLQGDGRRVAYGFGDGPPGLPRFKRWEIYYAEAGTLDEYARQLDFFKIELAAIDGDQVTYVSNFTAGTPTKRTAPGAAEKRLYMSWRQGNLKQADRQLLERAGVSPQNKLIVQFYPPDVENRLAQLELAFAGRKPGQIRRTRFAVRAAGDGFEYYVLDQTPL
jgi:hypothetical protein